jgi:hypothetical protein
VATIDITKSQTGNHRSFVITWPDMAVGDVGQPAPYGQYTDKSVQVVGAFGVGGVVRFEGSNNGVDWAPLTDPQGNALDFQTTKIEMVSEATMSVRPRVTAGDGSTSLTVIALLKE